MTRQDDARPEGHRQLSRTAVPGARRAAHVPRPAGRRRGATGPPGPRAARPGEAPVRRHLGHHGERRDIEGPQPGGRRGGLQALRRIHHREQRHRSRRSIGPPRAVTEVQMKAAARRRHRRGDRGRRLGRCAAQEPARRLGGDAPRRRVGRSRPAVATGPSPHRLGGGDAPLKESGRDEKACREALRQLLLVSSLPEVDSHQSPRRHRAELLRLQAPPVHLRRRLRLRHAGAAGPALCDGGRPAVPRRATRRSGSTRSTSAASAARSTTRSGSSRRPAGAASTPATSTTPPSSAIWTTAPREARPATSDEAPDDPVEFGFLTLHPADEAFEFANEDDDYPEAWLEPDRRGTTLRLKRNFREHRAREVLRRARRQGRLGPQGLVPSWQVPLLPPLWRHAELGGARPQPARLALRRGAQLGDHGAHRQRAALDARQEVGARAIHP